MVEDPKLPAEAPGVRETHLKAYVLISDKLSCSIRLAGTA